MLCSATGREAGSLSLRLLISPKLLLPQASFTKGPRVPAFILDEIGAHSFLIPGHYWFSWNGGAVYLMRQSLHLKKQELKPSSSSFMFFPPQLGGAGWRRSGGDKVETRRDWSPWKLIQLSEFSNEDTQRGQSASQSRLCQGKGQKVGSSVSLHRLKLENRPWMCTYRVGSLL